ncbi:MAG: S41 family peptidase [Leadbetterella sp.]
MKEDLVLFRQIREKANSGMFSYQSKQTINEKYKKAFHEIQKPLKITEFYKIILNLTDIEGSLHNETELPKAVIDYFNQQNNYFPLPLKYIKGKIYVNLKNDEIPLGSRILSINGRSDQSMIRSFKKYIATDGYNQTQKQSFSVNKAFGIRYLIEYGLENNFEIKYSSPNDSEVKSIILKPVSQSKRVENSKNRHSAKVDGIIDVNLNQKYSFNMLNKQTGLLNLRVFTMARDLQDPAFTVYSKYIDSVFNYLDQNTTQNLIIDIRNNPGGNDPNYEEVFKYLTDKVFFEHKSAYSIFKQIPYLQYFFGTNTNNKYTEAETNEMQSFLNTFLSDEKDGKYYELQNPPYEPKKPLFKGEVYLLIDENVASAASHFASLIRAFAKNAIIVGVETSGGYYNHNGHIPVVYELPNSKILTKFSIVNVTQDAPSKPNQLKGRGTMPDYEVWQTFEDFMNNRDTQMEFVLNLISSKKK